MITLYIWDAAGIYSHSVEVDPKGALPARSTMTAPPEITGEQVAQWVGGGWQVLEERPAPAHDAGSDVPQSVTMRQARIALSRAGLIPSVEQALAAMQGQEGEEARIEWEYSQEVFRDKSFVIQLGAALGLTEEQINQLFITASGIE